MTTTILKGTPCLVLKYSVPEKTLTVVSEITQTTRDLTFGGIHQISIVKPTRTICSTEITTVFNALIGSPQQYSAMYGLSDDTLERYVPTHAFWYLLILK